MDGIKVAWTAILKWGYNTFPISVKIRRLSHLPLGLIRHPQKRDTMKQRAVKDLCQLCEQDLFREVSTGMNLAISNALMIEDDAKPLYTVKSNSYDILIAVAREEAAKALILFDAIRCPRKSPNFPRQVQRFNKHLEKGIYAEMCEWEPFSKADLQKYLEKERQEFYLDGPNDVDWIFPNSILHSRERNMYVDYVKSSDDHFWLDSFKCERAFKHITPRVVAIVKSLKAIGCTAPASLAAIAAKWRATSIDEDFPRHKLRELNHNTLVELERRNLISEADETSIDIVVNYLPYPLHDVDLTLINVDPNVLERTQRTYAGSYQNGDEHC